MICRRRGLRWLRGGRSQSMQVADVQQRCCSASLALSWRQLSGGGFGAQRGRPARVFALSCKAQRCRHVRVGHTGSCTPENSSLTRIFQSLGVGDCGFWIRVRVKGPRQLGNALSGRPGWGYRESVEWISLSAAPVGAPRAVAAAGWSARPGGAACAPALPAERPSAAAGRTGLPVPGMTAGSGASAADAAA